MIHLQCHCNIDLQKVYVVQSLNYLQRKLRSNIILRTGCPKKMTRLYNVLSSKILNLTSSHFLQYFSLGWNGVLKDLMGLPLSIEILPMFENQRILSPVMIPKITSKIVLDIRECKKIFWEEFTVFMQKLVPKRREKER